MCLLAMGLGACAATPPATGPRTSRATTPDAAGLVSIQALVPDIDLDIRYAGHHNFTGAPVDGYDAPRCYLLRPAAEALARVETALRPQGYRLRIFDCYRPVRAVRDFMAWIDTPDDAATKAAWYPQLDKRSLRGDYIAPTSGHSRGATLDLTLLRCEHDACTPLDMGTPFDFFDTSANTDSPKVTPAQRANRHVLGDAMTRGGFRNYPMEWWHFTLQPEPTPDTQYDVPVR
ncbi:D-alanyl-D-alanine dipeptidase [Lysobacter helvus]|nr:D-alanyl-D-alanine dipeptidase [Lysobacter helvus]